MFPLAEIPSRGSMWVRGGGGPDYPEAWILEYDARGRFLAAGNGADQ